MSLDIDHPSMYPLATRLYAGEPDLLAMYDLLMQARGMTRISVSTGENNTPAIRLYESIGFKIVNRYVEYVRRSDPA